MAADKLSGRIVPYVKDVTGMKRTGKGPTFMPVEGRTCPSLGASTSCSWVFDISSWQPASELPTHYSALGRTYPVGVDGLFYHNENFDLWVVDSLRNWVRPQQALQHDGLLDGYTPLSNQRHGESQWWVLRGFHKLDTCCWYIVRWRDAEVTLGDFGNTVN